MQREIAVQEARRRNRYLVVALINGHSLAVKHWRKERDYWVARARVSV